MLFPFLAVSHESEHFDVTQLLSPAPKHSYDPQMERTFFVTSVTAQRRILFQRPTTADLLIDVVLHYRDQGKYQLHDLVVMPDRFHALITPSPEISLERAVEFITGGFSFLLNSVSPVWQASFTNRRIRDEKDFARHREYIRMNPVRAGLVRKPDDYSYSSATGRFNLDAMPNRAKAFSRVPPNAGLKADASTQA